MVCRKVIVFSAIVIIVVIVAGLYYYMMQKPGTTGGKEGKELPIPKEILDALKGARESIVFRVDGFENGSSIPTRYTCRGDNLSPKITIIDTPGNITSYVLIMYDPDAPNGVFYHWILYNIPGNTSTIPEGIPMGWKTPYGSQARNSAGKYGYFGPCPPYGRHRYIFILIGLDRKLLLAGDVSIHDVLFNARGHVLAYGIYYGVYGG